VHFTAAQVAMATDGLLDGPDVALDGVSYDSRSLCPGQLFVPIVADRDGHAFIDDALAAGAPAYLTEGQRPARKHPVASAAIEVADTTTALLALGKWARTHFPDRVVGITGSVGKTSVKDLAARVVGARWRTAASEKSLNNDWGLPATILNAPDDTEALVLEMGMRGLGEIARLCTVASPTVGVVTRVAAAHTERLGGLEGVARAKAELVEALPASGCAVLNADDPLVLAMAPRTSARVLTFGIDAGDVRVTDLVLDDLARPRFVLTTPWGRAPVVLPVSGVHMALNAAAAAAAGLAIDVPLEAIPDALGAATLSPFRMDLRRTENGAIVLNDAYNANPASMRAALQTLCSLPAQRRVAVLGVMAEIEDPDAEHRSLAAEVRAAGVELVAVGTRLYGVEPSADPVAAVGELGPGVAVLVKASRVAGLERVAAQLLGT
jgi:UDP-N-acetylmuramoyl-tripeptide--D-alanyl-D-alanine ligase